MSIFLKLFIVHPCCWEAEGKMNCEVPMHAGIWFDLNIMSAERWGARLCEYIIRCKYKWITIISSHLGTWLYCTQVERIWFVWRQWCTWLYCTHEVNKRWSKCDCQFMTAHKVILYTEARYKQYNAKSNLHMKCRDRCMGEVIWIITRARKRMLNENDIF